VATRGLFRGGQDDSGRFAKHLAVPYVGAMLILPRPVSPKSAFADLRDLVAGPLPHKWPILALSTALTGLIIWAFYIDARVPLSNEKQIIYVQSWMADRKDSDILKQQKADLANYEGLLEKKQREFQHVADRFGIDWKEDEVRNKARRLAVIAAVNKRLDTRIAEAEAREAGRAAPQPAQTANR
jgi:hypothetical protein